jgi:hypothetical protein
VGQAFSMLGAIDPRLNRHGRLDYRLTRTFTFWKMKDGPSQRKRPIPKEVLVEITRQARRSNSAQQLVIADLLWIGFFWLLRPSEYIWTTREQAPFLLCDVLFRHNGRKYQGRNIPLPLLATVSAAGFHLGPRKMVYPATSFFTVRPLMNTSAPSWR